jgi:hypothetical protein
MNSPDIVVICANDVKKNFVFCHFRALQAYLLLDSAPLLSRHECSAHNQSGITDDGYPLDSPCHNR